MGWIPVIAWLAAAVVAVVVLGFCIYELVWKSRRLHRALGELTALGGRLDELRSDLLETQDRIAHSGLR